MYKNLDLNALSVDDIVEEYKLLHDRHQQLKDQSEKDAQRIYELKRNLDTAVAAESYLTQELEQLSSQPVASNSGGDSQELEELRRKYKTLKEEQDTLQQDYDCKVEESSKLKEKLAATEKELAEKSASRSKDPHEDCLARLNALELENCELMQKLSEYEDSRITNTLAVAEKEKTIECLQDRVSCMEQNLNCKRDELEEKLQVLESCQEQLVDANAKIALLTSAPEKNDRKGNSLFAEVDDQRQVMKQLLAAQKKSYLDMKKTFTDSQFEIRRLKRENVAMHTELQACSTIFCSADKTYQNKLNERIRQLMAANDTLEKQLNLSQERLRQLASEKSVTWLDSMLDFCKRETDELKAQLHSMCIQKAGLEERMRSVQQEMARWRFESLKSRCVLIDRENLLTEHKISFKPMQAMEFNIKEAELKAALPRIVSVTPTSPSPSAQLTTRRTTLIAAPETTSTSLPNPTEIIVLDTPMKPSIKKEGVEPFNQASKPAIKGTPVKVKREAIESGIAPCSNSTPIKTIMGIKIKREVNLNIDQKAQLSIKKELETPEAIPMSQMMGTPVEAKCSLKQLQNDEATSPKDMNQNESEEDDVKTTETPAKPTMKGTPVKQRLGGIKVKSNEELLGSREHHLETPAKPQRKGTPVKLIRIDTETLDSDEESFKETPRKADGNEGVEILDNPTLQKPLRKGTPVRIVAIKDTTNNVRSILTKKRQVFAEDSQKAVKFSGSDPIVHNLSPVERLLTEEDTKENEKPLETEESKDIKPVIKRPNIIRRIVVSSRKPLMK
ncbi:protein Spindly [Drosophila rhopaloa]|uniref:Protein Spindly n=1 Tax=Drosophila rhopaloa TaxID=1041015 RepID=A0A6P4F680_DRORH|nr:protein Spindly [Drosophila rhopaloa]